MKLSQNLLFSIPFLASSVLTTLSQLPTEIVRNLCPYLSVHDNLQLSAACKDLNQDVTIKSSSDFASTPLTPPLLHRLFRENELKDSDKIKNLMLRRSCDEIYTTIVWASEKGMLDEMLDEILNAAVNPSDVFVCWMERAIIKDNEHFMKMLFPLFETVDYPWLLWNAAKADRIFLFQKVQETGYVFSDVALVEYAVTTDAGVVFRWIVSQVQDLQNLISNILECTVCGEETQIQELTVCGEETQIQKLNLCLERAQQQQQNLHPLDIWPVRKNLLKDHSNLIQLLWDHRLLNPNDYQVLFLDALSAKSLKTAKLFLERKAIDFKDEDVFFFIATILAQENNIVALDFLLSEDLSEKNLETLLYKSVTGNRLTMCEKLLQHNAKDSGGFTFLEALEHNYVSTALLLLQHFDYSPNVLHFLLYMVVNTLFQSLQFRRKTDYSIMNQIVASLKSKGAECERCSKEFGSDGNTGLCAELQKMPKFETFQPWLCSA